MNIFEGPSLNLNSYFPSYNAPRLAIIDFTGGLQIVIHYCMQSTSRLASQRHGGESKEGVLNGFCFQE